MILFLRECHQWALGNLSFCASCCFFPYHIFSLKFLHHGPPNSSVVTSTPPLPLCCPSPSQGHPQCPPFLSSPLPHHSPEISAPFSPGISLWSILFSPLGGGGGGGGNRGRGGGGGGGGGRKGGGGGPEVLWSLHSLLIIIQTPQFSQSSLALPLEFTLWILPTQHSLTLQGSHCTCSAGWCHQHLCCQVLLLCCPVGNSQDCVLYPVPPTER